MDNTLTYQRKLKIETCPSEQATAALILSVSPAPEKPYPGSPSKQVGDIVVIEKSDRTHEIVVSIGDPQKAILDTYRQAGGSAAHWLKKSGAVEAILNAGSFPEADVAHTLSAFLEGLFLGSFEFIHYKEQSPEAPVDICLKVCGAQNSLDLQALIDRAAAVTAAVDLAREWAHEPANVINPVTLAERVQNLAQQKNLRCTVLDDQELSKMNAGGIFSVGKGSKTGPRMIILEYPGSAPQKDAQPVVLVGKAITFDSGGYSMKDPNNMQGMKYDKCGGVNVAAILQAAADLKLATPIVGIICAAENMVSSEAYRPDDILTTLSGKTVEIITTDAEGRLVLCDGLTYAQQQYHPKAIIDMATLTGGVVTALGRVRAGMFTNNAALGQALIAAGAATQERLWELPLDEDYFQAIKGDEADLKNSGGREGHPIMGGIFLKQFVSDEIPWAHLDIAGVADTPKDLPYSPKGATGFGVRLLLNYLENL
jgi:leucyl aminopeptidase